MHNTDSHFICMCVYIPEHQAEERQAAVEMNDLYLLSMLHTAVMLCGNSLRPQKLGPDGALGTQERHPAGSTKHNVSSHCLT